MTAASTAVETQHTNVIGTLNLLFAMRDHVPDCHLVKLGTMGEYGTPEHRHRGGVHRDRAQGAQGHAAVPEAARLALPPLQGPRLPQHPLRLPHLGPARHRPQPGRRLRDRDRRDGRWTSASRTRFDYDECFGTVLNRFCVQAVIGHPLTVYGKGGQTRGFLNIRDTLQCVELAVDEPGRARRVPGLQPVHRAVLGRRARRAGQAQRRRGRLRGRGRRNFENPRVEAEQHYYNAVNTKLLDLGLKPHHLGEELVRSMLKTIERHRTA